MSGLYQIRDKAIWQVKELRPIQHRIVWWIVDAGAVGKTMARGWQKECSANLGIHRLTLRSNLLRMVKMGVMLPGEKRGDFILNASLFKKTVDRTKVPLRDVDGKAPS